MTDLLSVFFLIGIVVIFTVVSLFLKNTLITIICGLGWALIAIYLFGLSNTGDPDYGYFTSGLGWVATLFCLGMMFSAWWAHRKTTAKLERGVDFYEQDDFSTLREMYELKAQRNKLRGRK